MEEESGGTGERPAFKVLFADAHRKRFDLVLFWSLDRFSREGVLPTLQYLNQLENWGVGYKSLTEHYLNSTGLFKANARQRTSPGYRTEHYLDSTGVFKKAVISVLATLTKQEGVRLSERTKAGMARKVDQGVKMGAPSKEEAIIEQVRRLKTNGCRIMPSARRWALRLAPWRSMLLLTTQPKAVRGY